MTFSARRAALRHILDGASCIQPASVFDPISMRIAQDIGFEMGMFGGSTASLVVLGDPDLVLITLSELAEQVRRMTRAADLPVLVDADHGYGNALNVRRTIEELECARAAGVTIEDTLLPSAYGTKGPQLIPIEEGIGKMNAALRARRDPSLVIMGRTAAASLTSLDDAIARAKAYEATGVDALFLTGLTSRAALDAVSSATRAPLVLGNVSAEIDDTAYLASRRVRIANQGHTPIAAASEAIRAAMQALRDGVKPKALAGLPSQKFFARVSREAEFERLRDEFLQSAPAVDRAGETA